MFPNLSFLSRPRKARPLELMVTLWPSFSHFSKFANSSSLSGIRLNSAMITNPELAVELDRLPKLGKTQPLWFDAKGRQLRVTWVDEDNHDHLDIRLNHRIDVSTPTLVAFKAGQDCAQLVRLEEGGQRLIFSGGPACLVKPGESIHFPKATYDVISPTFTEVEMQKIDQVRKAGFRKYFLSYVESERDIDEFQELVGRHSEIMLKIENQRGLDFVANKFKKRDNLTLVAARGDLYVEVHRPHQILAAQKLIIEKDPEALVGSRLMLSVVNQLKNDKLIKAIKVVRADRSIDPDQTIERALLTAINRDFPSCSDFCELAYLYDIGYRRMMLCDELCIYEDLLDMAVGAFNAFRSNYCN